ncbi:hypothetical protein EN856_37095, partial [Mesorhizobium sp. M8A.F.Ca.ET.213.01.1.1]
MLPHAVGRHMDRREENGGAMKKDGHETFEEMVGPVGSRLGRIRLLATNRANRTRTKIKAWTRIRLPFILPARGPLSGLDGSIDMPLHIFS